MPWGAQMPTRECEYLQALNPAEPLLVSVSSSTQHTWWLSWGWGLETTDRVPTFPGDTFPGLPSLYTDEHTPHSLCLLNTQYLLWGAR